MSDQRDPRNVRHYPDDDFGPPAGVRQPPSVRSAPPQYATEPVPEWNGQASSATAQAAVQGNPPLAPPSDSVVTFSRAYQNQDEQVRQVRFRKPTTGDLRRFGYPLRNCVGPDSRVTAIEEVPDVIARYVTALSEPQLTPSTVNQMELDDFSKCSAVVLGFFLS